MTKLSYYDNIMTKFHHVIPGQVYTVSLSGERMDEGDLEPKKVKFIDFMVVAESNLPSTEVLNS